MGADDEYRWAIGGRLWCVPPISTPQMMLLHTDLRYRDILYELVFMSDLPLPSLPPSNEPSPETSHYTDPSTGASGSSNFPTPTASSSAASTNSGFNSVPAFIPAYSSDLGRLPLHIPLTSVPPPAFYESVASEHEPFGATDNFGSNPGMDDVLAALGFGSVSFEAPSMPAGAGAPTASGASETSDWPDFSLNLE